MICQEFSESGSKFFFYFDDMDVNGSGIDDDWFLQIDFNFDEVFMIGWDLDYSGQSFMIFFMIELGVEFNSFFIILNFFGFLNVGININIFNLVFYVYSFNVIVELEFLGEESWFFLGVLYNFGVVCDGEFVLNIFNLIEYNFVFNVG